MWIFTAISFSLLAAGSMLLFMKNGENIYIPVITAWFGAGAFYIFAFRDSFPSWDQCKTWFLKHRLELYLVGGITLLTALLRLYKLGVYPRVIDGDEGLLGLNALASTAGTYANPFALWENFGGLYLHAVNLAIKVFDATPLALRIIPAISGILAIPACYLFARHVAGKKVALIAITLLAMSHTHIHFSRIGSVGYIHGTWLIPLELFLLLAGLEKRKTWMTAAAGVLLAIHFCVYLTSQVVLALVLVFMLIVLLTKWRWFIQVFRQALAFWGGFLIMILPEFFYILKNPDQFFNRLTQDGTYQSGWIVQTMADTGQSLIQVLFSRVGHAFLSLFYYPAFDFYGSNVPMLTLFTSVFFFLGLVLALKGVRRTGFLLLNGYFWAITLAIGIFAVPPSADSYRMLAALPAAIILAALGIDGFLGIVGAGWERAKGAYAFIVSILLISLAVFNLWVYYGDFTSQCRYGGDLNSRFASYLGSYSKTVNSGSQISLLSDDVYRYGTHASTDFLSGTRSIINLPDPFSGSDLVTGDVVIASPNRVTELKDWIHLHPGGEIDYVYDCKKLIIFSYKLP